MRSLKFENFINFLGWIMFFILVAICALILSAVVAGIIEAFNEPIV